MGAGRRRCGRCPSTLRLILPEVYLEDKDAAQRVENIHAAMDEYSRDVLTRAVDGFVYVERTEQSGRVRQGLVGKIDLEAYSYEKGAARPSGPVSAPLPSASRPAWPCAGVRRWKRPMS